MAWRNDCTEEDGRKSTKDIIADFQGTDEVLPDKQARNSHQGGQAQARNPHQGGQFSKDCLDFRGFVLTIFHPKRYKFEITTPIPSKGRLVACIDENFQVFSIIISNLALKFTRLEKISSFSLLLTTIPLWSGFDENFPIKVGQLFKKLPSEGT